MYQFTQVVQEAYSYHKEIRSDSFVCFYEKGDRGKQGLTGQKGESGLAGNKGSPGEK